VAVVTRIEPEHDAIVAVAACHRDPDRERIARSVLGKRYRRGEGIPGRVWQTERGIWMVDVDNDALWHMGYPQSQRYLREVGVQSMMIVPLWREGRVVGTLGVARDPGRPPYTEEEFGRLAVLAQITPG
jgi:GAF domain-containing protein